jgi:hypothetical protein
LIAALRSPRAPDDVMMMVMMIRPVIEITGYPGPRELRRQRQRRRWMTTKIEHRECKELQF